MSCMLTASSVTFYIGNFFSEKNGRFKNLKKHVCAGTSDEHEGVHRDKRENLYAIVLFKFFMSVISVSACKFT